MNAASPVRLKTLVLNTYLPVSLYSIGSGAVIPVLAIQALNLGATPAIAALVVALSGLGELVTDLPAGRLVARVGERNAMITATCVAIMALMSCIAAPSLGLYATAVFFLGVGDSIWDLARASYLTESVSASHRARAMSALGGLGRMGQFVGPLLAALAIALWSTTAAFGIHICMSVIACIVVMSVPKTPHDRRHHERSPQSVRATIHRERAVLTTVGLGIVLVAASRVAKRVAIPLWGAQIGLDLNHIALIIGISGALDMILFYPAGLAMDKIGRLAVVLPSMIGTGLSYLYLPWTNSFATLLGMAIALGFSNGLAAGVIKTLGADFAPAQGRQVFLGVWNFLGSLGATAGPFAIGGAIACAGIAAGAVLPCLFGFGAAALMGIHVPRIARAKLSQP